MALFFIAHLLWYMIDGVEGIGYFFIYLTNWGYMLVTAYLTWSALSVTLRYLQQSLPACEKFRLKQQAKDDIINNEMSSKPKGCSGCTHNSLQWYEIIHWILFVLSSNGALTITLGYWLLLFKPKKFDEFIYYNLSAHLFNSLVVLMDIWITRLPVRIYHFFYVMFVGSVYSLFTGLYYVGGGRNEYNDTYIYQIIDYKTDPGLSVGLLLGVVLVGVPLINLFLYCNYLLREGLLYVVKKYCCKCLIMSSYETTEGTPTPTETRVLLD
jgi:hypothetical protein